MASRTESASPSMNQAIAALRHLGDAAERSVLEVGLADEAHLVLAAAAAEAERVGEGEARERGGVGAAASGASSRSR